MLSAFLEFVSLRQKILPFLKHENPGVINRTQSNVNFQMNRFQSNANHLIVRLIFRLHSAIERQSNFYIFLEYWLGLAWIVYD